jgi:kinesin family protein 3/17
LIRQYEVELRKLRTELDEKTRLINSNELVIQLEEEKKRAEEDKQAAIFALEQASRQYIQEREEKKRLEMKISMMNSQLIVGGHKMEDTPQFRSALEERQTLLLKEFDEKLQEFEKERQQIEEDKAQVERYKQLLLKQRDIMIALTNKLNERDEAIVQLQEELDAYDKINREQEEVIENKNQRLMLLENIMKRNNIRIPDDNVNQLEKEKYYVKGKMDKVYLPYEVEKNGKEFENTPMTLLSPDEKVREMKNIVKEQEKEIYILKIVSQKFINNSNERNLSNLKEIVNKTEKDYELNVNRQ